MKVIFVCTGNTCRSPMAEGYLKSMRLPGVEVLSRGLYPGGDAVSENSAAVMREAGIDIGAHISKQLTYADTDAELFACMEEVHARTLINAGIPEGRITVLGGGIPDPYGRDENAYRACRDSIFAAVDKLVFSGSILPFRITRAVPGDADEIAATEKAVFADPWSKNAVLESMNASTLFFIAKDGDKTAGYIGVSFAADESYITNIAVKEEYRRRGAGALLLCRAVSEARDRGMSFISLEVRVSNAVAIRLYGDRLFKEEGRRRDFYKNPREDAIIMTRRFFNADTGY